MSTWQGDAKSDLHTITALLFQLVTCDLQLYLAWSQVTVLYWRNGRKPPTRLGWAAICHEDGNMRNNPWFVSGPTRFPFPKRYTVVSSGVLLSVCFFVGCQQLSTPSQRCHKGRGGIARLPCCSDLTSDRTGCAWGWVIENGSLHRRTSPKPAVIAAWRSCISTVDCVITSIWRTNNERSLEMGSCNDFHGNFSTRWICLEGSVIA